MKKKSLIFALALIMVFAMMFVGCQKNEKADETTAEPTDKPVTVTEETKTEEVTPEPEPVEIDVWYVEHEDWQTEWQNKWIEEFNAGNEWNITVQTETIPSSAYVEKLTAAQAVQEAPDVLHYAYNKIVTYAREGRILPLTDYVSEVALNDIYPAIQEMITFNGEIYAYPELAEPAFVLYYWKDKFEEAGLDPEKPPVTMDELVEYARALTNEETYGLSTVVDAGTMCWSLLGMRWNVTGHRLIDDEWANSLALDENYYKIANLYKTLVDEELISIQPSAKYVSMDDFLNGECAMKFCGSWGIGQIRDEHPEWEEKIGVAVSPTFDGNQAAPTASTGGWNLCIDALSDNPEAAGTFIEWLIGGDTEHMVEFYKLAQFGKYPIRKSVDEALGQDEVTSKDEWYTTISQGIVPYCIPETIYPGTINLAFGNALQRVFLEGMTPEESFAIADQEIKDIIANEELAGKNPALGN